MRVGIILLLNALIHFTARIPQLCTYLNLYDVDGHHTYTSTHMLLANAL